MSDIQRYVVETAMLADKEIVGIRTYEGTTIVVTYAHHLTAMQAAQTISSKVIADFQRQAREAALREALAAVEALYGGWADWPISLTDFGAAISAIQRLIDGGDTHD